MATPGESDSERRITLVRRSCRYEETERLIDDLLGPRDEKPAAQVELGRIAMQRQRWDPALAHFERALELDPDFELALAWKVAALSRLFSYRAAFDTAEEALRRDPKRNLVRVALARVWEDERGDSQRALDELDRALDDDPTHLEALEWRIAELDELGRYDEAERQAGEAFRMHPEAAELLVMSSITLKSEARYEEAVQRCEQALRIHSDFVNAQYWQIDHLLDAGRFDEAARRAEQAIERMPWVGQLHYASGRTFSAIADKNAAVRRFGRAVELEPDDDGYHSRLASELFDFGHDDEAWEAISRGRERLPRSTALLIRQARFHEYRGELDSALSLMQEAVALDPLDSIVLTVRIDLLRSAKRFEEAERVGLAAMESHPADAQVANELGWVYAAQDRDEEALSCFRRAVELEPKRISLITDVALALRWLHRLDEAELFLRNAKQSLPESVSLVIALGEVLEKQGRYDDAVEVYLTVIVDCPNLFGPWVAAVRLLRQQNRLAEAERLARQAVEANPHSADLRISLMWVYDAQGRHDAAIAELRQAWQDLPHATAVPRQLAIMLSSSGAAEEALEILAGLPDEPATNWWRIDLLQDARRYDEALELASAQAEKYPRNTDFRVQSGEIRAALGDEEAALAEFVAAMEVNPANHDALENRVFSLRRSRQFDEAEQLLLAEIAKRPNYADFVLELGRTYWQMGRREEGLAQYERALGMEPHNPRLLGIQANALRLLGRFDEAEAVLTDALRTHPNALNLLAETGRLRDDQNRYEEALDWYDKALAVNPSATGVLVDKSATLRSLVRFAEAERVLQPALARWPNDLDLSEEWGWVLRDRGELTRARKVFEENLELARNPGERAAALHGLGWVAFTDGDLNSARQRFTEALGEKAHLLGSKLGLAWTLVRQGEPEGESEVERLCHEVLREDPRRHNAHTCLGVLYAHQNDLPQAEYHLRRSIEIDPFAGSYVDLGALFVQMDRFEEGRDLLEKALARNWYDSQAHIELGSLFLQQNLDDEGGPEVRTAVRHFRQALVINPASGAAAIGLALALAKLSGDLVAAERVLREALRRPDCDQPRWQLLVALARLLIERGDATQRRDLHLEALSTAQQAIEIASDRADPYYVAGIAAYKAGESGPEVQARPFYRRRALRYLRSCLRHDAEHAEARRVMTLTEQSLAAARSSLVGSVVMLTVAGSLLVALWLGFFLTNKVTAVMIGTLTPVLAGLVALGFVLPFLVRLRLPGGVEADLSASLSQVSSGPTGEVSIGPGRLAGYAFDGSSALSPLSSGPRGELPRLG